MISTNDRLSIPIPTYPLEELSNFDRNTRYVVAHASSERDRKRTK